MTDERKCLLLQACEHGIGIEWPKNLAHFCTPYNFINY